MKHFEIMKVVLKTYVMHAEKNQNVMGMRFENTLSYLTKDSKAQTCRSTITHNFALFLVLCLLE